jgi:tRNA(fMet)-specific endonuclease VapC
MLVLDTDHLSELHRGFAAGAELKARLLAADDEMAITIVSVEEQVRGRLAEIARARSTTRLASAYRRFQESLAAHQSWNVLEFDDPAGAIFDGLKSRKIRVGTMDQRIASIVLVNGAMLLTRNQGDFAAVPGLKFDVGFERNGPDQHTHLPISTQILANICISSIFHLPAVQWGRSGATEMGQWGDGLLGGREDPCLGGITGLLGVTHPALEGACRCDWGAPCWKAWPAGP